MTIPARENSKARQTLFSFSFFPFFFPRAIRPHV
jgi:hypothetical protein